jgi:hypothetical protein
MAARQSERNPLSFTVTCDMSFEASDNVKTLVYPPWHFPSFAFTLSISHVNVPRFCRFNKSTREDSRGPKGRKEEAGTRQAARGNYQYDDNSAAHFIFTKAKISARSIFENNYLQFVVPRQSPESRGDEAKKFPLSLAIRLDVELTVKTKFPSHPPTTSLSAPPAIVRQ